MALYRYRPVTFEAEQYFSGKIVPGVVMREKEATIGGRGHGTQTFKQAPRPYIDTEHGEVEIRPGDWIIRQGDKLYRCSPDVFDALYEPVPEGEGHVAFVA